MITYIVSGGRSIPIFVCDHCGRRIKGSGHSGIVRFNVKKNGRAFFFHRGRCDQYDLIGGYWEELDEFLERLTKSTYGRPPPGRITRHGHGDNMSDYPDGRNPHTIDETWPKINQLRSLSNSAQWRNPSARKGGLILWAADRIEALEAALTEIGIASALAGNYDEMIEAAATVKRRCCEFLPDGWWEE